MTKLAKLSGVFVVLSFFTVKIQAQNHQLIKLWETDSVLKVPESVLYDEGNNNLYGYRKKYSL